MEQGTFPPLAVAVGNQQQTDRHPAGEQGHSGIGGRDTELGRIGQQGHRAKRGKQGGAFNAHLLAGDNTVEQTGAGGGNGAHQGGHGGYR
jgi:hypothetical protein